MPDSHQIPYDDMPIGVLVIRRDRKELEILDANKPMRMMLGGPVKGQILEEAWQAEEVIALAKRLKSPTPPEEATLPIRSGGEIKWTLVSISQTLYGNQDAYIFWATDISASKAMETDLRTAAETADAIAEQKSNFLATMSHEIRTPMQSVYGLLELIEQAKPPSDILTMAKTAKDSASGLLEILDDVLDFAKMDADQLELDLFEVPVRTLVRGINEALAVKVQGKPVDLLDDIDQEVPFVIVGDPKRLRQIIMNLMGNAMKFTHDGSVTIAVSKNVKHIHPPEGCLGLRFEIRDTGIGMSKEVAGRLFKAFSQADNSTSRKYGGTGLGLSISKKLVELMGGEIGVESEEGKGSTFWFEFPTEEVDVNADILDMPELDGISVISVEDHPQGAKEIVKSLKSMNATIESCPTYAEALDLIKRRPFDVAVIDQGLPDGLGLDLIREVMEIRPFTGLIMYTVRDDAGLQHTLQSLGVTYLAKPASRIGLGEAVLDAAAKHEKLTIDGPTKLIIAEDTASVRDVLQRQLALLGVEATFAENGVEALAAVRSGEYGILITDLHMPEKDGYALVREIRLDDEKLGRHFPIIAMTADVQMSQRQAYMGHGFDECLLKPVSLGHFRRLLVRWGLLSIEGNDQNPVEDNEIKTETVPDIQESDDGLPPAIDQDAIIQQMGTLDDNTIEMLEMFVDMTAPLVEEVIKAYEEDRMSALMETAHSLKGAARSACANVLGDLAADLQTHIEHGGDQVAELSEKIPVEFERVKETVQSLKNTN